MKKKEEQDKEEKKALRAIQKLNQQYPFKVLDGLVTNFHLPESTLIMLVSAFAGYDNVMNAYKIAVEERYRFFSFGDACFFY